MSDWGTIINTQRRLGTNSIYNDFNPADPRLAKRIKEIDDKVNDVMNTTIVQPEDSVSNMGQK